MISLVIPDKKATVSIIIPVYNRSHCVFETIDTVINQIDQNFECIIVDDGSTDESYNMIETYIADLPNFKLYHKENGGLVSAVKYGISKSTCEYVGFLDSDDKISEEWVLLVNKAIKEYNSDGVEFYYRKSTCLKFLGLNNSKDNDALFQLYEGFDLAALRESFYYNDFCGVRWNKVVKKDILNRICEFYDDRLNYGEDIYFAYAYYTLAKSVVQIHKQLIEYCPKCDSMIWNMKKEYITGIETLCDIIMNKTELGHNDHFATWLVNDINGKYNDIRNHFGLPWFNLMDKIKII